MNNPEPDPKEGAESARLDFAIKTAEAAGVAAMTHFRAIENLAIEKKGHQDMVSNADREVEQLVRSAIADAFPDDGIIGEEYDAVSGASGFTWIIDPIDGTANFVAGIPAWTVVLACVTQQETKVGVIHDPNAGETYSTRRGNGAWLNGKALQTAVSEGLGDGSTGVGFNGRVASGLTVRLIANLVQEGGVFYRNASGALMLAYVAAGRLIGYTEPHMNAWDCVAGMLLVEEAGGRVWPVGMATMLRDGGPVIAATANVYGELARISAEAFELDNQPTG